MTKKGKTDGITLNDAEVRALVLLMGCLRKKVNNRLPYRRPKLGDELTWQEQMIVDILKDAGTEVPTSELIVKIRNQKGGGVGEFLPLPSTQVCRIRDKLGDKVIKTVWQTKINKAGQRVRDQRAGASYLWVGKGGK